eukprot:TRINITY_DN9828_c0_g1_i1.p1 TRINITY_DN9828_c0_g1~~TRINITY_DN9828_c0_g1_i1.p1  ORF type:complete len:236 (-),score=-48.09 TRINITY_DN9828_c0_g1_i1:50-757(-)
MQAFMKIINMKSFTIFVSNQKICKFLCKLLILIILYKLLILIILVSPKNRSCQITSYLYSVDQNFAQKQQNFKYYINLSHYNFCPRTIRDKFIQLIYKYIYKLQYWFQTLNLFVLLSIYINIHTQSYLFSILIMSQSSLYLFLQCSSKVTKISVQNIRLNATLLCYILEIIQITNTSLPQPQYPFNSQPQITDITDIQLQTIFNITMLYYLNVVQQIRANRFRMVRRVVRKIYFY